MKLTYKDYITKDNSIVQKVKDLEKLKKTNPKLYEKKLKYYQDNNILPKLSKK